MALGAMLSLLNLRVVLEDSGHHKSLQQALQLLQEGFEGRAT